MILKSAFFTVIHSFNAIGRHINFKNYEILYMAGTPFRMIWNCSAD